MEYLKILVACITITAAKAQETTERDLLAQQIIALATYAKEARQGYQIVQQGLQNITSITQAELRLHQIFFAGLAGINPKLFLYVQVYPPLTAPAGH